MRLSAFLVAVFTASATFGLSNSANCQTTSPETSETGLTPNSAQSPNWYELPASTQQPAEIVSKNIPQKSLQLSAVAFTENLSANDKGENNNKLREKIQSNTTDPLEFTSCTNIRNKQDEPNTINNSLVGWASCPLDQKQAKNSATDRIKQIQTSAPQTLRNTPQSKRNPALEGTPVGYVPHSPIDIAQAPEAPNNPPLTPSTPPIDIPEAPQAPPPSPPRTTPAPPTGQSDPQVLVAEVVVSGVEGELQDRVYAAINTQPGRTTTRSQLQQDINAIFATGFFRNVRAVPEDSPLGVRVTFIVQANPILRGVTITGQQVLPQSAIDEAFRDQYGKILNLRQFEEGVKKINKWYQDNGYVLGQVTDAPQVSDDGNVTLQVAEGLVEAVEVRFLNKEGEATDAKGQPIQGNTRQFIITREVELKPGDVFNRNKAERDLRRVFGLGIFEDVRLGLEPGTTDPRKARVIVNVIEKNTGSLAAGAGISSASGLFGTVSYQQQNLGGNNQRLGAELQIGERATLFDINFTDPWIAGDPYRTSYTVNAFRRRSISVIFDGGKDEVRLENGDRPRILRTGGGVTFTRPLDRNPFADSEWVASVGFQYQRVSIRDRKGNVRARDEDGNKLSFSNSGSDDILTLQAGVVRDRRDDALRPTRGSVLRFGMEQSIPVGSGAILFNRIRGGYSYYIPVRYTRFAPGPQTLAFNVQAGTILGDLPPYEAFALGGANSVRGYDEGDVGAGRSFIQATAEYRFPIISFIGGALFVDAASDLGTGKSVPGDPAGVRGKPGSGVGAGFGVRIQSPLGPIRIDYGFNVDGGSRLHFGIGERF
ncbi:MAG TPA: BamA/TamA family outer membrane protein [Kamptonema sp.]|nr:BamA/TamA family outer membrane protein [Kamptonema sp.]